MGVRLPHEVRCNMLEAVDGRLRARLESAITLTPIPVRVANRDVAQLGSAPGLGPGGLGFKSLYPDQLAVGKFGNPLVLETRDRRFKSCLLDATTWGRKVSTPKEEVEQAIRHLK